MQEYTAEQLEDSWYKRTLKIPFVFKKTIFIETTQFEDELEITFLKNKASTFVKLLENSKKNDPTKFLGNNKKFIGKIEQKNKIEDFVLEVLEVCADNRYK